MTDGGLGPRVYDYIIIRNTARMTKIGVSGSVEQAVVYSTSTTGLSTLTFRGEVVAGGGGVEEKSEVMYWHRGAYIIYYRDITGHSYIA